MPDLTAPRTPLSHFLRAALLAFLAAAPLHAQQPAQSSISGVITDPSGALVSAATITLHPAAGSTPEQDLTTLTLRTGRFNLTAPSGTYTVTVSAPGFAPSPPTSVSLSPTHPATLDIRLKIESQAQEITVSDADPVDPDSNGDAIKLNQRQIDNLPADSAQMLQQLQALSGGDAPELYVNGFSGGKLPPRASIREIRINQNPYSAQNDTNPTNGQIQVFTKPGADKFHGSLFVFGNDSSFNSLSPFVKSEPPYHAISAYPSLSGPINKHNSFFLGGGTSIFNTNNIVDAQTVDAAGNPLAISQAVSDPFNEEHFEVRIDSAIRSKSTLTSRYALDRNHQANGGVGQFSVASQGYDNLSTVQTLQLSNSQILSTKIVNDTRFQYIRTRVHQTPNSFAQSIVVQGAINDGGSNAGEYRDNQDRYELQNYVSASEGKHYLSFGGRFRYTRDSNQSRANYNGQYLFSSLTAYQLTIQGIAAGSTPAQIRSNGGGASQYSITTGSPSVVVSVGDAALYFQDDWKARPNLTLSTGLRFETQTSIADHADFAPRFGISYGFGVRNKKPPVWVARLGSGFFYKRFGSGYVLQSIRQNGITQQQFIVTNPDTFPNTQPPITGTQSGQVSASTYQISPTLCAQSLFSTTLSLQRQLGPYGSATVSFVEGRGVHNLVTRNINAPLPGTFNPAIAGSGVRPLGGTGNVYRYDSAGVNRSHLLTFNVNFHYKQRVYFNGYYRLRSEQSDGSGGAPSNSYDLADDYGRASNDIRNNLTFSIYGELYKGIYLSSFVRAQSGTPFNIVVGQDLNGDSSFNDRPAFASDLSRSSVVHTAYGNFDVAPVPGQIIIPVNYGTGPAFAVASFTVGRTFEFGHPIKPAADAPKLKPGEKPRKPDRPYSLDLLLSAENVFNHPNYAVPVSTLGSPLFGKFTSLATSYQGSANRLVNLQLFFHF